MIAEIREYIEKCPLLKGGKVNVNYLSEKPMHYTIEPVPCIPVIRKYVDGGSCNQFLFVFASRETYDKETIENIKTAEFYEDFLKWVDGKNKRKKFPEIPEGEVTGIEVLSSGYAYETDETTARFQMQMRIVYLSR